MNKVPQLTLQILKLLLFRIKFLHSHFSPTQPSIPLIFAVICHRLCDSFQGWHFHCSAVLAVVDVGATVPCFCRLLVVDFPFVFDFVQLFSCWFFLELVWWLKIGEKFGDFEVHGQLGGRLLAGLWLKGSWGTDLARWEVLEPSRV